jgi:flagellar hook assembly protein FlgD
LTPTNTPLPPDDFWVSRNVFHPEYDAPPVFVRVRLSQTGVCSLKIYNSAGELVRVLLDVQRQDGTYKDFKWDGLNKNGEPVASGVYVVYYTTRFMTRSAKLLVVR